MDFKDVIYRTITSFIIIFIFAFIFIFYDNYILFLGYLIYLIIFLEINIYFRKNFLIYLSSIIYLIFSLICLNYYFLNYYQKEEFIFTVILIVIFDIASYIIGSKYGRLRLLPVISPNKTYMGLIGGFIITFIISYFLNFYYQVFETRIGIIFICLTMISAFIGDIIESFFKRKSNLKNSSYFLPGHGGFFDRFDSIIMVVIWLFLFNLII